jgi:hypothetical protein
MNKSVLALVLAVSCSYASASSADIIGTILVNGAAKIFMGEEPAEKDSLAKKEPEPAEPAVPSAPSADKPPLEPKCKGKVSE